MAIYCEFCGNPTEYLSVGRVAQLFNVQRKTVRRWIQQGRFSGAVRIPGLTGGSMYKIPVSAVLPLLANEEKEDG